MATKNETRCPRRMCRELLCKLELSEFRRGCFAVGATATELLGTSQIGLAAETARAEFQTPSTPDVDGWPHSTTGDAPVHLSTSNQLIEMVRNRTVMYKLLQGLIIELKRTHLFKKKNDVADWPSAPGGPIILI